MQNFFDPDELKRVYYPEVERLIGERSGAARVVVFDHTLRSGDEAEALLARRFAIIQAWRAIDRPIRATARARASRRALAFF